MTNLETIVLAKLVKAAVAKAARNADDVVAGRGQQVRLILDVDAVVNIGEDYMRTPTVAIPWLDAMAIAIHDAGITGGAAINAIMRAITAAMNQDEPIKRILKAVRADLATAESRIRDGLDALPQVNVKGPITFDELTVTEVQRVVA